MLVHGPSLKGVAALGKGVGGQPDFLRPWLRPRAYANSLAVYKGEALRLASGLWWVQTGGTTASSGAGPTDTASRANVADGSAALQYLGPDTTSDDPSAPVVSQVASGALTGLGLSNNIALISNTDKIKINGGQAGNYAGTLQVVSFSNAPAAALSSIGGSIEVLTDAPIFAVSAGVTGFGMLPHVNDRPLRQGCYDVGAGAYVVVDCSAWGAGTKRVKIAGQSGGGLFNPSRIVVPSGYTIAAPSGAADITSVHVSDSFADGSNGSGYMPQRGPADRMALRLGWAKAWNLSKSGTGFVNKGSGSAFYNFRERVPQILSINPSVVVLDGSVNDYASSGATESAAVAGTIGDLRAGGYTNPIIVFGLAAYATPAMTNAQVVALENSIAAGVTAAADASTYFIPRATDASPWIGASDVANMVYADDIHVLQRGSEIIWDRSAAAIRTLGLTLTP